MKKQLLVAGIALSCASQNAHAFWPYQMVFEDPFQMSERIRKEAEQQFAQAAKFAKACQEQCTVQADYTLQSYEDKEKNVYGILVKLNGPYGKQAPTVTINTTKNAHGDSASELEIEASTASKASPAANTSNTTSSAKQQYISQSSTMIIRDDVVSQQISHSRASVQDGVLRIKHTLPKNIRQEGYSLHFEDGQLKLEFSLLDKQPAIAKKALVYTTAATTKPEAAQNEEVADEK